MLNGFEANIDINLVFLIRLFIAALCGAFIGFERKARMKEAGLRTHAIVCLGSALFTIVSIFGFKAGGDASRVAAQIVTGIGFLGAGMIIFRRNALYGLTTAAGIWATAGIGMAFGTGMYHLGLTAAAFILLFQFLLHSKLKIFATKKSNTLLIECSAEEDAAEKITHLFENAGVYKTKIFKDGEEYRMQLTVRTHKEYDVKTLLKIIKENPFMTRIDNTED